MVTFQSFVAQASAMLIRRNIILPNTYRLEPIVHLCPSALGYHPATVEKDTATHHIYTEKKRRAHENVMRTKDVEPIDLGLPQPSNSVSLKHYFLSLPLY